VGNDLPVSSMVSPVAQAPTQANEHTSATIVFFM
jgi:hypothetical protein